MPPVLAYWDIRGLAQPIRILLNYAGEEFEDKYFECGDGPEYNRDCWNNEKNNLGLDFPNLPYYIDGDIKVTQSNAILKYIGRKHDLCGKTEQEKVYVDIMLDTVMDFRNGFVRLCYSPRFKDIKGPYMKELPTKLQSYEKFIGSRNFLCGENATIVDFPMYEMLDQHRLMEPDCLNDYPKLKAYLDRFEALPAVKKYMSSDKFMKWPINNKMARFGAAEPKAKEEDKAAEEEKAPEGGS